MLVQMLLTNLFILICLVYFDFAWLFFNAPHKVYYTFDVLDKQGDLLSMQ